MIEIITILILLFARIKFTINDRVVEFNGFVYSWNGDIPFLMIKNSNE